jgi:hypothetical protein
VNMVMKVQGADRISQKTELFNFKIFSSTRYSFKLRHMHFFFVKLRLNKHSLLFL